MISKSVEVNPEEELTIHSPISPQVMGTPDTPDRDVVPVNVSPIPVKKWYQIDFNPAAFCKRVFQSVYSEPLTRSDSSSQKTYITGRMESISEIKSDASSCTTKESVIPVTTEKETCTASGPPSIQEPILDLHVQRREAATFVTRIIGFPTPVVSWYKDGKPLSPSKHVKLAENSPYFSLTLVNTGSTDNGFYTCTAKNSGGEVSCKAKLTVERDSGVWKYEVRKCSALVKRKRRSLQSLYKIHEEIGRGSFGVVNRVTSRESGNSFAGKFLPMRRGSRSRALNERDLLARVSHPRVACLLDSFCSRQTLVLLTELCSSHTLLDHLLSKASVKESEVGTYIQQVLEGIEHIHSLNILHLDINPSNILMTLEKEEVKICDFGLSQNIDPSRQQYSKYGMPEFVAPEIASQAPVTKGTDIWSLGVLSYLCLTCHCPFSGESDCATLLRVCEGQLSWDTPDVTSRGSLAQDFLHRTLQSEPKLRPTASECLSHEWFQRLHEDNGATDINTKNLTAFISKNRQQQSLTCYGAALVQKTIAEILASIPQDTSLVGPRTQQNLDSPSLSSGSSSEYDEIETWATPLSTSLPLNLYKDQDIRCLETENQGPELSEERATSEVVSLEKQLEEEPELTSQLRRGDSTSSLCTDDEGSTGGRVPRESLIKSTFYSSSEELSPLSARRMLLQQKKRTKRLESSRVRLRSGFSSGLGEPLLEDMEGSAEEDTGGSQRRGSSQSSAPLTKSCSFDSGPVPCSTVHRQRRSRSLGEYSRRTPSTSELRESGVEVDVTDTFSSQEHLGQDRKNNERVEQSADTISDSHSAIELKEISPKNDKDCMAELVTKNAVEIDVLQLTASNGTEVGLFEDVQEMTDSVSSPKRFDEGMDCHAVQTGLQEKTEEMGHSFLKPIFVESTTPVSVVQDVSELLGSQYGLKLMERPRSMDLLFKALETLEKENRAHFPKIHKSRSDEGIHKPSDLALLAPEPTERAHSAVCGLSASEEPCGVTSVPSKELDIADITAEIAIKKADSSQELFLNTPHDEDLCDSIANVQYSPPEPEVKASGPELDYGMVESAEEVYPGLLDDKMSCDYLAGSQNSITHLFNRGLEEACGGADAYAGLHSEEIEEESEISSGKASHMQIYEEKKADLKLEHLMEEIHTYEDHFQMAGEKSGWSESRIPVEGGEFLENSGSLRVLHRGSKDIGEELQRYPSTPTLEAKVLPGTSRKIIGFFRRQSWTSQSTTPVERVVKRQASEGDSRDSSQQQQQTKISELSISKRVRASVASFSKAVLGRQTNKEDKKEGTGMKYDPSFPYGKSQGSGGGSPKKSSGLFSLKLPGFKRSKGPVFVEELEDQAVSLGEEVTLWCRLSGHPTPEVQWYKEARRLKTTDQIRLAVTDREFLSLTIYSAKEEDLGSYRCVASNAMGQASTSCTLIVSELPTCPTSLQVYQLQGNGVMLVWRPVESITELTYCIECSRDGRGWGLLAEGMADSYYMANNLARGAQYEFRVACLNRAGKGSFSEPSVPTIIGAEQQGSLVTLNYTESYGPRGLTGQAPFSLSAPYQTYSLLSDINRGRFSVVKRCREDLSGQLFAAKITPFKPQWRQWALREYQLLRRLNHAHLVQLHAAFITPCHMMLILELYQGRELLHHLAERDLYGEMHVQAFLQQILSVINYLHRRRIAHLDIKSDNMLVNEQNQLKLLDLGSAHVFTPGQPIFTERLLELAESKAPEVLEGQGVGPETDIWAIGLLTFIMLSADEPFNADGNTERECSVRKGKLHFGRCYTGLSEGALSFMKRALNSKPQSRPSTAECLQLPWIQGARQHSKHRDAVVCFTTDKLRSYLQEHERRRHYNRTKLETSFTVRL